MDFVPQSAGTLSPPSEALRMTRLELRQQGETMLRTLFGSDRQTPGLGNLLTEAAYGGIWSRLAWRCRPAGLRNRRTRHRATAAGPATTYRSRAGPSAVPPRHSERSWCRPRSMPGSPPPRRRWHWPRRCSPQRGLPFPADPPEDVSLEELDRRGADLMARLHGARATQGYAAPGNPVTGALYPTAIRYGYGEIWSAPAWSTASAHWWRSPASPRCACPSRWRNSASRR